MDTNELEDSELAYDEGNSIKWTREWINILHPVATQISERFESHS